MLIPQEAGVQGVTHRVGRWHKSIGFPLPFALAFDKQFGNGFTGQIVVNRGGVVL